MDDQGKFNPFMAPSSVEASRQQQHKQAQVVSEPIASFPEFSINNQTNNPTVVLGTNNQESPVQSSFQFPQSSTFVPQSSVGYDSGFADSEYQRQMQELRRREDEIATREKELYAMEQNRLATSTVKEKNFPPLPKWFCLKPCFYININNEIPSQHVRLVKFIRYYWLVYCGTLFINFIASCCYTAEKQKDGVIHLVLSIMLGLTFAFLSFYTQFYAAYRAISADKHFYYVMYFVSTAIAIVVNLIQVIGIIGSGWCGIFVLSILFNQNTSIVGGIFSVFVSFGFLACATFNILLLKKVHSVYRSESRGTIEQSATAAVVNQFTPAMMNQNSQNPKNFS